MVVSMTSPIWGGSPHANKHDWIRSVTGYTGQFGSGGFNAYGAQHGFDPATMTNVWNALQQGKGVTGPSHPWDQPTIEPQPWPPSRPLPRSQPQSRPQPFPWSRSGPGGLLGGWGGMPALQGLLGGYPGPAPVPVSPTMSNRVRGSWPAPGPALAPAGTGHTMLWTA